MSKSVKEELRGELGKAKCKNFHICWMEYRLFKPIDPIDSLVEIRCKVKREVWND